MRMLLATLIEVVVAVSAVAITGKANVGGDITQGGGDHLWVVAPWVPVRRSQRFFRARLPGFRPNPIFFAIMLRSAE